MRHIFFYALGLAVLFLNKFRYGVRGYREPRPFAPTDSERAINYDRTVVDGWLKALHDYTDQSLDGKVVLELGPGADLGPALFLLDAGARQYITVDANRLIDQTPRHFYNELLKSLPHGDEIKPELEKTLAGNDDRIRYTVDPTFNLTNLPKGEINLVVSQAAFEHFSDVEKTINQLSSIVKSGAVLIAEVDLMTHTGILRSRDPLNIYRYPASLYRLAQFSGIPNRVRPQTYKTLLEKYGWHNIEIVPLQTLPKQSVDGIRPHLAQAFRDDSDMYVLTFLLRAKKS